MAVDIEGFDIVFSKANANHAKEIDQSIARMSEKVPVLTSSLSQMAKALDELGKLKIDTVKNNIDAVKNSLENIDGSKLNKVFEVASAKSEGLLSTVTSLVNMLGKVDMSSLRGGGKTEVYDERTHVKTTKETNNESQSQEQINALIRQREQEMQSLRSIEEGLVSAEAHEVENAQKKLQLEQRELQIIEQQNGKKTESVAADNATLAATQAVVKEYNKAEKELEKMANKLGIAFQGAPQELQDYVGRTRSMLNNLISDINASLSDPSQMQLWKGLHFPNEQIRTEFEALLKDLKGEADAYFTNLWSNVQTNVGRGKGYTAKSVESIGDNWDMDSRSYLSNAEEKLERMYLLLQHIRDYGNQPFFEGLQKDITNIAALDERIAVLDAQIEAVQKDVFSMPASGEYGDVLTHRMQQLQNMRELLEHIRDAQSHDMVDGDMFAMNEQDLKERLEKQKQAVIEAEREAQKQVGTDWEDEAKRELENRKKILADTQLAVSSLGLLGDQNEIKNAKRQAASYKEMQERLAQNTKDKIAQLDREIAEEKQKLEVEKQQTNELEKQKNIKQTESKTAPSSSQEIVIPVKFDEKTVLSEIKNISDRLTALFKEVPVSLKKELDLTYFEQKSKELKAMFSNVTVPITQNPIVQKTEGVAHKPQVQPETSQLSTDTTKVLEAAFERMEKLTSSLVDGIKQVGATENTVFTELRNDIQGVTTALQGLVDMFAKASEKEAEAVKNQKKNIEEAKKSVETQKLSHQEMQEMYNKLFKAKTFNLPLLEEGSLRSQFVALERVFASFQSEFMRIKDFDMSLISKQSRDEINTYIQQINQLGQAIHQISALNIPLNEKTIQISPILAEIEGLRTKISAITTPFAQKNAEDVTKLSSKMSELNGVLDGIAMKIHNIVTANEQMQNSALTIDAQKEKVRELEKEWQRLVLTQQHLNADGSYTDKAKKLVSAIEEEKKKLSELTTRYSDVSRAEAEAAKIAAEQEKAFAKMIAQAQSWYTKDAANQEKAKKQALAELERLHNDYYKRLAKMEEADAKRRADIQARWNDRRYQNSLNTPEFAQKVGESALQSGSVNDLVNAQKRLKAVMDSLNPNDSKWKELNNIYQQTKTRLDDIKKSMEGVKAEAKSLLPNLQNLAMKFGVMFSVQQLMEWTKHMTEVRAQFELQNIALRSIIQNKEKADEVFAEVQQLALKSPFSIMQLNTYTKQIAAYGVEADKLVGTTKELADVSAGLGVDMGRLILAYGQVKTANFLRATEVRQFTEAGLNITQELANYFTELNGKMVRASEVTDMITKRMVKFEDVAEVFKRVTSAGGMFYNMQEKQAEGLHGQMQRIGDAYSMMLNSVGKDNEGVIVKVLATIREMIQNWRQIAVVLKSAAVMFGVYKTATTIAAIGNTRFVQTLIAAIPKLSILRNEEAATIVTTEALGKKLKTVGKGIGASLVASLPVALITFVLYKITEAMVEAAAKAEQLADSMKRINEETSSDLSKSLTDYERLAKVISDGTRSYEERKDAMEEMSRTFKDILSASQTSEEYIIAHAGHWDDAKAAMKEYYNEQKLRKAEEAADEIQQENFRSLTKDLNEKMGDYDLGLDNATLTTFVNNVIQQIKDGTITTTQEAVDSYIHQIELYTGEELPKELSKNLKLSNASGGFGWDLFGDIVKTGQKWKQQVSDIIGVTEGYTTAQEKADAETRAFMKSQADGVKDLVTKMKDGLSSINSIQTQIARTQLTADSPEKAEKLLELEQKKQQAIADEVEMYNALGLSMPDWEEIATSTSALTDEMTRMATETGEVFASGINPQIMELRLNYNRLNDLLVEYSAESAKGAKADSERLSQLRQSVAITVDDIREKYRIMGISASDDIQKIARSQDSIVKEMGLVANRTSQIFRERVRDKINEYLNDITESIQTVLDYLGIDLNVRTNFDEGTGKKTREITASTDDLTRANKALVKSIVDKHEAIADDKKLYKDASTSVDDYVKTLKSTVDSNTKILDDYKKAKDKEQWLSLHGETEASIKELKDYTAAAKEIAQAYDPDIFDKKKGKGSDNTEQLLRNRINLLKEANKMYEKLNKEYSKETAAQMTYNNLLRQAKDLKIESLISDKDFTNKGTLADMEALSKMFNYGTAAFKKKYANAWNELMKQIGEQSYEVSVDINKESREKVSKELEKMLGSYQLFIELDKMGIDGDIVQSLFNIDYTSLDDIYARFNQIAVDSANKVQRQTQENFEGFKSIEEAKAKMGSKFQEMYTDGEKKITDTMHKEYESRMKDYMKYLKKSYGDATNAQVEMYNKLRSMESASQMEIDLISANKDMSPEKKQKLIEAIRSQSERIAAAMRDELGEKLNEIQWKEFKENPIFEKMFGDLDKLGEQTIDALLSKIRSLKKALSDVGSEASTKLIREMAQYEDKLFAAKAEKSPFTEYIKALKEIRKINKEGQNFKSLNADLASQSLELSQIDAQIEKYQTIVSIKENQNDEAVKGMKLTEEQNELLKIPVAELNATISRLKQEKNAQTEVIEETKEKVKTYEQALQAQEAAKKKWQQYGEIANQVLGAVREGFKAFEHDADAKAVIEPYLDGFEQIMNSVVQMGVMFVALGVTINSALGIIGIVATAVSAIFTAVSSLNAAHDASLENQIKKDQRAVDRLQRAFENLSDAIDNAFSGVQLGGATRDSIANLKEQNKYYSQMIAAERAKKDSDEDKIVGWQNQIEDNIKQMKELQQQFISELGGIATGADVLSAAQEFVDAWADAFEETGDGLKGLQDNWDSFMRNILKKQAYMKVADHWIANFSEMINKAFDENGQVDYEKLDAAMQYFTGTAIPQIDSFLIDFNKATAAWGGIAGDAEASLSGLTAGIQSVTEETAQILEALLNSMRYYVADTNDQLRRIVNTLVNPLEENPFLKELKSQTNYLASIDRRLASVISATKRTTGSHINVFTT